MVEIPKMILAILIRIIWAVDQRIELVLPWVKMLWIKQNRAKSSFQSMIKIQSTLLLAELAFLLLSSAKLHFPNYLLSISTPAVAVALDTRNHRMSLMYTEVYHLTTLTTKWQKWTKTFKNKLKKRKNSITNTTI